jgi:hypothetical protein
MTRRCCPLCRTSVMGYCNRFLERIIKEIDSQLTIKEDEMSVRLTMSFDSRRFPCPLLYGSSCFWNGTENEVDAHLISEHGINTLFLMPHESSYDFIIHPFLRGERGSVKNFIIPISMGTNSFVQTIVWREDYCFFIMQYVGNEEKAKRWETTLFLEKENDDTKECQTITISTIMTSYLVSIQDVISRKACAYQATSIIARYITNDLLKYRYSFRPLEEEKKSERVVVRRNKMRRCRQR